MAVSVTAAVILGFFICASIYSVKGVRGIDVGYDGTSLIINGTRKIIISGSIHYPRSTPDMWPGLIEKAKEGGLDCIQTYVFWNMHEPQQGKFNFEGRFDLVGFMKTIQSKGMYASLRIGPYIESEWNFGGFPYWLHDVPGIVFRTDNEPFKREMERFTTMIVRMMQSEGLFASQGGPIIISQIENEYGNVEAAFPGGHSYVVWAASMTSQLNTGVPWVMCKQPDAPDPVINTCNGMYCGDTFIGPNSNTKPKMWTEAWTGWFQVFGGSSPHRPVEDIAYAVATWFAKHGTFVNYYMYHGGTNFGRTGGPFITTSYDYDAPIDEYGTIREPKWSHLKDLNMAIKLCSDALLFGIPDNFSLGPAQEAHIYRGQPGICAAFLLNRDSKSDVSVNFQNLTYNLPAWSVSILPDCQNVAFNTAKVNAQSLTFKLNIPQVKLGSSNLSFIENLSEQMTWEAYNEINGGFGGTQFQTKGLLEQITTTKDATDYLWYSICVDVNEDEPFLKSNISPEITISSRGYAVYVFVNNIFVGSVHGNKTNPSFNAGLPITLVAGQNYISLLSVVVGLPNSGAHFEQKKSGIGYVAIQGFKDGTRNLSEELWTYQIGLGGETLNIYSTDGSNAVNWTSSISNQALTWYKTTIDAPEGDGPVSLDLSSMGKGQIWINEESIGRYWISFLASPNDCSRCDYRGTYSLKKCATNCGQPSQTLYHVPRSLLQPTANFLVLLEEIGGEPSGVSLLTRSIGSVCGHVSETHPSPMHSRQKMRTDSQMLHENAEPMLRLECSTGKNISSILFASFGNPQGKCGNFIKGTCHSVDSMKTVKKACVGQNGCSITVSSMHFGADPCVGTVKRLAVEAVCN